ncbi:MAG: hypothetical protein JW750_01885 [Anaerolineaceae bacterium]|nr:hypothetical protein [Anaerolineaceae bacterium]
MDKIRKVIASGLLLAALYGLGWALLRPETEQVKLLLQPVLVDHAVDDGNSQTAALLDQYELQLSVPTSLKVGQRADLTFVLYPTGSAAAGLPAGAVDVYDNYRLLIELRPDLAAEITLDPAGSMQTGLLKGDQVEMAWTLRAEQAGAYEGVFWVVLHFYPLDENVEIGRYALLARAIEGEAAALLGLNQLWAGVIAAAAITFSIFLWFTPFLMKKRRSSVD